MDFWVLCFLALHFTVSEFSGAKVVFGGSSGSWFKKKWRILSLNLQDLSEEPETLLEYSVGQNSDGSLMGFCAMQGLIFWADSSSDCLYSFAEKRKEILCDLNEPQGIYCSNETFPHLYFIDSGQHYGTGVTSINVVDVSTKEVTTLSSNKNNSTCFDNTGEPRGIFFRNNKVYVASDWSLWTLGNFSRSCGDQNKYLGPGDIPDLDGEPIIAESLVIQESDIWFTRFYGGVYRISDNKVMKYAETKYGTFDIAFVNDTHFVVSCIMDDKDTHLRIFDMQTKENRTLTTSIQSAGVTVL